MGRGAGGGFWEPTGCHRRGLIFLIPTQPSGLTQAGGTGPGQPHAGASGRGARWQEEGLVHYPAIPTLSLLHPLGVGDVRDTPGNLFHSTPCMLRASCQVWVFKAENQGFPLSGLSLGLATVAQGTNRPLVWFLWSYIVLEDKMLKCEPNHRGRLGEQGEERHAQGGLLREPK